MANSSIRNLDDGLFTRLKMRAARRGNSTEAEVRAILRDVLVNEPEVGFADLAADMRALTAGRNDTPAEVLLREGRDER